MHFPSKMLATSESTSDIDPSFVWKQPEVANTFTDIRDSVPLGKEQLDLMVRIIRYFKGNDNEAPLTWLDLGCGDGPLSRKLLQEFPDSRGILLDFSEPMLQAAQAKIEAMGMSDRVALVSGDLLQSKWQESISETRSIDVIVSSFAIHHLTDERKQELYREIYDVLSPGGVFLNLEHIASPDTKVEGLFDGAFVDSMYDHFQGTKTYEECQRAVAYDLSVDDEANLLAPVETQCDWLRKIGFQHVDCYFKFLIIALFGGVKQRSTD